MDASPIPSAKTVRFGGLPTDMVRKPLVEELPRIHRLHGFVDRALTSLQDFRIANKSVSVVLRNKINGVLFGTLLNAKQLFFVDTARIPSRRVTGRPIGRFASLRAILSRSQLKVLRALSKHTSVFLDIGGNYGFFGLFLASLGNLTRRVVIVEPSVELAERIVLSVEENDFENTWVVNAACGEKRGKLYFSFNDKSSGISFVSEHRISGARQVPVVTLDHLVTSHHEVRAKPPLVKIDVEGAEVDVLRGGLVALERGSLIMCEVTPTTLSRCAKISGRFNYQAYDLAGSPINVSRGFGFRQRSRDIVLIPESNTDAISALQCA